MMDPGVLVYGAIDESVPVVATPHVGERRWFSSFCGASAALPATVVGVWLCVVFVTAKSSSQGLGRLPDRGALTMLPTTTTTETSGWQESGGSSSKRNMYSARSHDIEKSTWAVTNASAFYEWVLAHLPVYPSTDTADSPCGSFGRVSLCSSSNCSSKFSSGQTPDFGLHVVQATTRIHALELSVGRVEAEFATAFSTGEYAALMEQSLAMWSPEGLDGYFERVGCARSSARCFTMEWRGDDDGNTQYYSLFVLVPSTQVVLELVSDVRPSVHGGRAALQWGNASAGARLVRVPSPTLSSMATSTAPYGTLTPLVVSRATSNLSNVLAFYDRAYGLRPRASSSVPLARAAFFSFSDSSHQTTQAKGEGTMNWLLKTTVESPLTAHSVGIRFVEINEDDDNTTAISVATLEQLKIATHESSIRNAFCGFNRWFDNHFGVNLKNSSSMLNLKRRLDLSSTRALVFGHNDTSVYRMWQIPGDNLYIVEPTGDVAQVNGIWECEPLWPTSFYNNAANLCSEGMCDEDGEASAVTFDDCNQSSISAYKTKWGEVS
jgi:hypothetical protein